MYDMLELAGAGGRNSTGAISSGGDGRPTAFTPSRVSAKAWIQSERSSAQRDASGSMGSRGGMAEDEMGTIRQRTLILAQCRKDGYAIRHAIA